MNDLSQEARSLLAVARGASLPAGPRRQNIKRKVLVRIAAVAGATATASMAGATSLAGKLVLTGIVATMATGGAIGVWKWRTSGQDPIRRAERAPVARHERTPSARPESSPPPVAGEAERTVGLGAPPVPVLKLATRDRPLAPAPSPMIGGRTARPEEAPRAESSIPSQQPALVPPPLQGLGQGPTVEPWLAQPRVAQAAGGASTSPPGMGRAASAWPTYPAASPSSSAPAALPSAAQEPSPQVASSGRDHPTFQARQPMLAPSSPTAEALEREVAELQRAQEALRTGQPALALRMLAEYDRAYPAGSLHEERAAIAAIATCQVDPGPQARARAQAFLREAPRSLLANRVRAACLQQGPAAK